MQAILTDQKFALWAQSCSSLDVGFCEFLQIKAQILLVLIHPQLQGDLWIQTADLINEDIYIA